MASKRVDAESELVPGQKTGKARAGLTCKIAKTSRAS